MGTHSCDLVPQYSEHKVNVIYNTFMLQCLNKSAYEALVGAPGEEIHPVCGQFPIRCYLSPFSINLKAGFGSFTVISGLHLPLDYVPFPT